MGFFERLFGKKRKDALLDGIQLVLEGFEYQGSQDKVKVWRTPDGDGLGIYAFALPPDLPHGCSRIEDFRMFYEETFEDSGAKMVEVKRVVAGSVPALWVITKMPQEPSGMTYVGSVTIPFKEFSFVLKVQCPEHGMTGAREAMLMDRLLREGKMEIDDDGKLGGDWNPDADEYDAEFPTHPVSRVRRSLARVLEAVTLAPEVRAAAPFPLPSA